jgi:hypothetical protein
MKRINIPLILDSTFSGICAFVIFFTAIRFYTKNIPLSLAIGAFALVLFGLLAFVYISKKQNKTNLISKDVREKQLLKYHLTLSKKEDLLKLAKSYFGEDCKICGNRIYTENTVYFAIFKLSALLSDDILNVIKFGNKRKKVILCPEISIEANNLCTDFEIEVLTIEEIFCALKGKNLLPEKYILEDRKKPKFFKRIQKRFNKKLCSPLFFSGLSLIVLSYFTFFPIYYILCGTVFIILSSIALVFG